MMISLLMRKKLNTGCLLITTLGSRACHTSSTLFKILLKSTKKCGYDTPKEPFKKLVTQGMVCHETFKTKEKIQNGLIQIMF